jgi:hypothetical protein
MKMKACIPWLLPIVGFAAGWLASVPHSTIPPAPATSAPTVVISPDTAGPAENDHESKTPVPSLKSLPLVSVREALSYASRAHRLAALMRRLEEAHTAADFAALYAEMAAIHPFDFGRFTFVFFDRWAQVAPLAALDACVGDFSSCWSPALKAWAARDPMAAIAWGKQHPRAQMAYTLWELQGRGLPKPGEMPPREALQHFRERMGDDEISTFMVGPMNRIFSEWAKNDPDAAWSEAQSMPDVGTNPWITARGQAMAAVLNARAASDPAEAARMLATLPEGESREILQQKYMSVLIRTKQDKMARNYAYGLPEGPDRSAALAGLADALYSKDDAAGAAIMASLSPQDLKDLTLFAMPLMQLGSKDPEKASAMLLANIRTDSESLAKSQELVTYMFSSWAPRDPAAAMERLLQFPEEVRDEALNNTVRAWCYGDPAAAGQWAAALSAGPTQDTVIERVAEAWTRSDSPAAGQWALALPAGPTRDQALERVAATWADKGAKDVTHWLETLPAGSGHDAAVEGFARTVMGISSDDALAWLRTVPNEADRLARLRRVWESWRDRDAAHRWLDASTDLTSAERAALQR